MSTNYYVKGEDCPTCGHTVKPDLHIGKSSGGWKFSLHIDPDNGIETLDDWVKLWSRPGAVIRNEYGDVVSPADMLQAITQRTAGLRSHTGPITAKRAPSGATYDYVEGDFS